MKKRTVLHKPSPTPSVLANPAETPDRGTGSDAAALIANYRSNPPRWAIEGLLSENEIAGLHGPQEVFKTIFCVQLQEALASGKPFLDVWRVPKPRRTLLVETEMSPAVIGRRLAGMYRSGPPPSGMLFASETELRFLRRAVGLQKKFQLVDAWVRTKNADALILDTCNPLFRGKESANAEEHVGEFFDLLEAVPVSFKIFVRHNHKRRNMESGDDASLIRGSGQFGDVPDLLMQLRREDRRTNEATLSVSKFRHGTRPDDLTLWFDPVAFRLTALPPVIYALFQGPCTRAELLIRLEHSFGISSRKAEEMLAVQRPYLLERSSGRARILEINHQAAGDASWARYLFPTETVQNMRSSA